MKKRILQILKVYGFTWLFCFLVFFYFTFSNADSFWELINSFFSLATRQTVFIAIHMLFLIFLSLFLIAKYFISTYKKKGFKIALKQFSIRVLLPVFLIFFIFKSVIFYNQNEDFDYEWNYTVENNTNISKNRFLVDKKIRGMNVFNIGRRKNLNTADFLKSNIEWISVVPYFYQETENSILIDIPKENGIWSKRDSSFIKDIEKLHQQDFYVMIKPHLWMSSGWRSNINFTDKKDWNSWFENYHNIMLHYAKMAEITNADLLCIGTELRSSLKEQPQKWLALVKEIKTIYKGKITYAANWDDDLDFTEFWNKMDYIGIQAYFPLTKNSNPDLEVIKNGWDKHLVYLKKISETYNKKILFTEVGYRNDLNATIKPWEWSNSFQRFTRKKSDKTQALAYQALYDKLWNKHWFAGTFPWEWNSGDFPIYEKPAENVIAIWYGK